MTFREPSIEELKGFWFDPGENGLVIEYRGHSVVAVAPNSQASTYEVQLGWIAMKIDGEPFTKQLYEAKKNGTEKYEMIFRRKGFIFYPGDNGLAFDYRDNSVISVAPNSQGSIAQVPRLDRRDH